MLLDYTYGRLKILTFIYMHFYLIWGHACQFIIIIIKFIFFIIYFLWIIKIIIQTNLIVNLKIE